MVTMIPSVLHRFLVVCNIIVIIILCPSSAEFDHMKISPSRSRNVRRHSLYSPPERITIRLRTPPKITRRIDVLPSGKDSRIIRVKPVTRYPIEDSTEIPVSPEQLYDTLNEMGLHTISSLLRKSELLNVLINKGPITFFAPTDEAISLLPPDELEELHNNPKKLNDFILYHMTKGHVRPQDVRNDITMASLQSSLLRFNIYNHGQVVTVSGAKFLDSGQISGWTLIQPIDRVLNPISRINLSERIRMKYPEMHSYLMKSGLSDQLAGGTFTLFVPKDEAFQRLPEKLHEILSSDSNVLRKMIVNHVVPGAFFSTVFTNGFDLRSLGGDSLTFTSSRGHILVNGVPIRKPDIAVTNGIIHELNSVIIPQELIEMCQCMPMYTPSPATVQPQWPTYPVSRSETIAFGTRIKIPFSPAGSHSKTTSKEPFDEPTVPDEGLSAETTTTSEISPDSDVQSSFVPGSTRKEIRIPITQLLTSPMDLPDGTRVTFSKANQLLRKSLLINRLRHASPYTLLLPTDEAFSTLPQSTLGRLEGDRRLLRRVLLCHLIDSRITPDSLQNNGRVKTLGGNLVVNVQKGRQLMIGGGRILSVRSVPNGVVYVTNRVAFPVPHQAVDHVLHDPSLATDVSIWSKIIQNSGMQTLLKGPKVYTMFVPSNAAFLRFPHHTMEQLYQNKNMLQDLVSSHVVEGSYYKSMITPDLVLSTINGNKLRFRLISDGFMVNDAPVLKPGIVTGNGVVYVISSLLYQPVSYRSLPSQPPEGLAATTTLQHASQTDLMDIGRQHNATLFLNWMMPTGFPNIIQGGGRYTLFLPTNVAMRAMSPTLRLAVAGDPRQRRRVIQYHISPTSLATLNVDNDLLLPTLLPTRPVRCNVYHMGSVITVNGGPIVNIIPKENLTVVIVNQTLTPPVGELLLTISKSPMLRNFTKIIKVAEMEDELKNGGPYTVFAPIKCAFGRLSPHEYGQLIKDRQAAREFVLRHVVKGSIYTSGIKDGMSFKSQYPSQLNMRILPTCITVNNVKIKYGDISATNGVVHIVADVL